MPKIDPDRVAEQVYTAAKAAFSELMQKKADQHFYAFALFTDDSLQFLHAVANSEEALTKTVKRYRKTVDPEHGTTSTRTGMRWSYGDWGFFPEVGAKHFKKINDVVSANMDADEKEFEANVELLWPAILQGFQRLEKERFFGTGPERSKITLLLVGDLDSDLVNEWVSALNPPDVAERFLNWDADAPDSADENG